MANLENKKTKRRYLKWLGGAKGSSESTTVAMERAIHEFENFTEYKSFKTFCERQATGFKRYLEERRHSGRELSNVTKYHTLRHLNAFFSWLATQPGYKSRISLDSVSYLCLDRRTVHEVLSPRPRPFPSLEQVKALVGSIKIETEIDRRDRALIAFLLLTGVRYKALCSLSLGCFDADKLVVYQDPRLGVHTKGGKAITTWVLRFDKDLVDEVLSWTSYLTTQRRFGPTDPLFPRSKSPFGKDESCFEAVEVEPVFWSGGNSTREILKKRSEAAGLPYFHPHSFRHAACQLALKLAKSPEQLKALSQNFGHEQLTTTLRSYGTLDQERVASIISEMYFVREEQESGETLTIEELQHFIEMRRKKT